MPLSLPIKLIENSAKNDGIFATQCDYAKGIALVLRDSFSDLLIPHISSQFRRVLYIWTAILSDETFIRLVQQEKPDVVIEERGERILTRIPKPEIKNALKKLSTQKGKDYTLEEHKIRTTAYTLIQKKAQLVKTIGGKESITLEGNVWNEISSGTGGYVENLIKNTNMYQLNGWATIPSLGEAADFIFVTKGNDVIFVQDILHDRNDVAIYFSSRKMRRSGFTMRIPHQFITEYPGVLRVFAVCGETVNELIINPDLFIKVGLPIK